MDISNWTSLIPRGLRLDIGVVRPGQRLEVQGVVGSHVGVGWWRGLG